MKTETKKFEIKEAYFKWQIYDFNSKLCKTSNKSN